MASDARDRISDLYHAALQRAPDDRRAFLEQACAGDEGLRQDVESLLRYESGAARLLEQPAAAVAAGSPNRPDMLNRQLGPYTIVAPLGAGGMGEVYRARDSKLGRDVAIKILPSHFTADPERRARFAREARLLATLNHPHIGAIYGLEETDDVTALVLELVEGPTLAQRLERGPLPIADAFAISRQIAEALDAAHEKGIVHRDLKPANIVLQSAVNAAGVPSGDVRAKVLDFGLAKTMALGPGHDLTQQPPGSLEGTAEGRVLGTPAYMSPEQARGQAVDKRTDIWAFGCVLFEMLSGRRAFDGDTISDTFVSILEREPDWAALPDQTPAAIRTLLDRCLRKDPRTRLHDIADARIELDDRGQPLASSAGAGDVSSFVVARHKRRERLAWIVAAAALTIASSAMAFLYLGAVPPGIGPLEFPIAPPEHGYSGTQSPSFEISPDGQHITTVALSQGMPGLWIRKIASPPWSPLPGTEGARGPFWSPDSQSLGFFAGGQLKTISLSGGPPVFRSDAFSESPSGAWSRNGFILFGGTSLWKVRETGGNRMPATTLQRGETVHRWPSFLPDGEHFLYLAQSDADYELRIGSLTSSDTTSLGPFESNAVYAAGHLLFVRGRRLMAQPFDAASRQWKGDPVVVADETGVAGYVRKGQFSVSSAGVLGYCQVDTFAGSQLTWMDRKGGTVGTAGEPGVYLNLDLSPDEKHVAVSRQKEQTERPGAPYNVDIWLIDLVRAGISWPLTDHPAREFDPAWSAREGTWIAFNSARDGASAFSLFRRRSNGSGEDEPLVPSAGGISAPDWSHDGNHLLYAERKAATGHDLWTLSLSGNRQRSVFLDTKHNERSGTFSPDTRWIAYVSDESGRNQVHVRPFPRREGLSVISQDGGWAPRWRSDGRELFFLAPDGALMAAGIEEVSGALHPTVPQRLFPTGLAGTTHNLPYAVARDGQRFLIPVKVDPPTAAPITVVLDWRTRLAK